MQRHPLRSCATPMPAVICAATCERRADPDEPLAAGGELLPVARKGVSPSLRQPVGENSAPGALPAADACAPGAGLEPSAGSASITTELVLTSIASPHPTPGN